MNLLTIVAAIWILSAIGAAIVAESKRRTGLGWFFIGALGGPISLLTVGFMPAVDRATADKQLRFSSWWLVLIGALVIIVAKSCNG